MKSKIKKTLPSIILAFLFSFWFTIGLSNINSKLPALHLGHMNSVTWLILLALTLIFFLIIMLLNEGFDALHSRIKPRLLSKKQARVLFAILFVILLRYYVFLFVYNGPGSVATDTYDSIRQYIGIIPFRNDNPFLTTLLYGFLHSIGQKIIGGRNGGIYLNLFFQAIVMSWAYVRAAFFMYEKTGSLKLLLITWACYLILPVFGCQAQIWLKDSLHSGIFTLFFIEYVRMFDHEVKPKTVIRFCLLTLLAAMTRKATFYIMIICILALGIWHFTEIRKKLEKAHPAYWTLIISTLIAFFLYDNVLLTACGVKPGSSGENYVIPFRQTVLVVKEHEDELSAEDLAIIDTVMDHKKFDEYYSTENIDAIKRLANQASDQELAELLKLDLKLFFRYPLTSLQAITECSWRYFYPLTNDKSWARIYITEEDTYGWFVENPTAKSRIYEYFTIFWEKTPGLTMFTDPGLYMWLLFFILARSMRCRNKKALTVIIPLVLFALGLTATPINGDLRYAFPIICALPPAIAAFHNQNLSISNLPADAERLL